MQDIGQGWDAAARALATLSEGNHVLVHAVDETALLKQMCEAITETGGYLLAWYGRPVDDDDQSVMPVAAAGPRREYVDDIRISWGPGPLGEGPTGRCIRGRQTQVVNDLAPDPSYTPWQSAAAQRGFQCSISLPVLVGEDLDGALMVYAGDVGAFDARAQSLLEDLSADLGYGLSRLRNVERLESTLDSLIDPFIMLESVRDSAGRLIDLRYTMATQAALEYNQITRETLIGAHLLDLFPGQLENGPLRQYFHTIETGEPTILDDYSYGNERLDSTRSYDIRAVKSGDGIALTWRDVTDRHIAAQRIADSEHRYRLIADNSTDVILLVDLDTAIGWVSPSASSTLGWDVDALAGCRATDFIHPDDLPGLTEGIAASNESMSALDIRLRWRRPDGAHHWMGATGRPFVDPDTGLLHRVVALRDIDDQMRAEQELARSERLFRTLAENSSDVVILADDNLTVRWASPSSLPTFGLPPETLVGRSPAEFVHPDDLPRVAEAETLIKDTGIDIAVRYRWRRADATYYWAEVSGRHVEDVGDGDPGWVLRLRDIDDQVRAEDGLREREERYRLLAENVSDIVWQVNPDGTFAWVSPSVLPVLGWDPEDLIGTLTMDLIHPDEVAEATRIRAQVLVGEAVPEPEFRLLRKDGSFAWMSIQARRVPTPDGISRIVALRDISDRVTSRTAMEYVLEHDQLTGLPSRRTLTALLDSRLAQLRAGGSLAVVYIDIDGLSAINEGLGQGAGDVVIAAIASRISSCVIDEHFLARGSGDEFAIVLPSLSSGDEAATIAEEVLLAVRPVVEFDGHEITPTVSIGIAIASSAGDAQQLLKDASLGARQAKMAGGDCQVFADAALALVAEQRLSIESVIRAALNASTFVPWFQPIIALDTGALAGYEALARWVTPDGVIEPSGFMDIAEGCSAILDLDATILQQSVRVLAGLPEDLFVSVNVTATTLSRTPYLELVRAALSETGVRASRLRLEITETMLLARTQLTAGTMRDIADLGVRWYVDDFGTGYSSISHLRDLPIAGLKLDRSFTSGIGDGERTSMRLADALIGLARGLGLETVAEGVETQAEADYLRTLGWKYGQGWLYGKAAPLTSGG